MAAGLLLIAAAAAVLCLDRFHADQAGAFSEQAAERVQEVITAQTEEASPRTGEDAAGFSAEEQSVTPVFQPDYVFDPGMEMPVERIDGIGYVGKLEIPALSLELPVIGEWSYPNLRKAPCRYEGTAYQGNFVILAHNYDRHFGRLGLLEPGDPVCFTDMKGNRFSYQVILTETLGPFEEAKMTEDGYDLTLFTCTGGGTLRLAVRCRKNGE